MSLSAFTKALDAYLVSLQERQCSPSHVRTVAWRLGLFARAVGETDLSRISRLDIAEHLQQLASTRADGTMAGLAATHRAFWRWCHDAGHLDQNLGDRIKRYSYQPMVRRAAPVADIATVAAALPAFVAHRERHPRDVRDALLVSLSLDSGARLGAMGNLRRRDVLRALEAPVAAADGRLVYSVPSKGKTGMAVLEFCEETAHLFRLWLALTPSSADRVFVSLKTGRPLRRDSLSRAFEQVCRFAEVPVFRAHAVRKRNITEIIQTTDPETAQRYAGHKDLQTTLRHYKAGSAEQVRDATAGLASRRRGGHQFEQEMAQLFGLEGDARP